MTPEQNARQDIDKLLSMAGWTVQYRDGINLGASLGVALEQFESIVEELENPDKEIKAP